jgi:CMP-N,N'-diacetyllegionaminic acid synthase
MKNFLITICARGGSKGLPKKNILPLNNTPMICYSIKLAKEFAEEFNADIAFSTDDSEIRDVANNFGLYTKYERPDSLATDQIGKLETIIDLIKFEENAKNIRYEYFLDLDVSSPLRNMDDLRLAFTNFSNNVNALNLFSVSRASKNPYFNMVEVNESGFAEIIKKGNFLTRQSAPDVFDMNASFYFYRRSFFFPRIHSVINGKSMVWLISHLCFDIDHEIDYEFMKFLVENNKLDFKL